MADDETPDKDVVGSFLDFLDTPISNPLFTVTKKSTGEKIEGPRVALGDILPFGMVIKGARKGKKLSDVILGGKKPPPKLSDPQKYQQTLLTKRADLMRRFNFPVDAADARQAHKELEALATPSRFTVYQKFPSADAAEKRIFARFRKDGSLPLDGFDVDLTYNRGGIHRRTGLTPPTYKFDKVPQKADVQFSDVTKGTPLPDASQRSVLFDPPYQIRKPSSGADKSIRDVKDLGIFPDLPSAVNTWTSGVREASRILKRGGTFMVKIQDLQMDRGMQRKLSVPATQHIIDTATRHGFSIVDKATKRNPHARSSGKAARTSFVNYIIFKKD